MDKSNKIENLANKYVERHIRDRHLSDDTIKEIKIAYIMIIKDFIAIVDKSTSMNENDVIHVINRISSILYEPIGISNTDKKILEIGIALGLKGAISCIFGSLLKDDLTGGFPCQPFSVAGQRKGADDNRYLWPEMLRVIRETRPLWVIGENVAGITNMVQPGSETDVETKSDQDEENYKETILEQEYIINTICDDLEREGYSVQPIIVPACGVGAPHKRYRIWFIASDCSDARVEGLRQGREDKINGFEFTSQTRDKIRRLITDTSGITN